MSLSPLLVATSSVENAVFSQCSSNNVPLRRGGGEKGGWTDVSGLSWPGRKRYRYMADPHTWTEGRRVQLPRPSIVGPLLLKAAFCRPLIPFLSTRKRDGSSTPHSQPTLFAFPISRTLFPKGNFHLEISANVILQTDENIPRQDQARDALDARDPRLRRRSATFVIINPEFTPKKRYTPQILAAALLERFCNIDSGQRIHNYKNETKTRLVVEKYVWDFGFFLPPRLPEKFRASRRSCEIERAKNANFATAGNTGKKKTGEKRPRNCAMDGLDYTKDQFNIESNRLSERLAIGHVYKKSLEKSRGRRVKINIWVLDYSRRALQDLSRISSTAEVYEGQLVQTRSEPKATQERDFYFRLRHTLEKTHG
ncbi:hypothetical protein G5I_01787 [Acromyrmex echinatior]|uniref:Uncharacterized protein n=1 Tax=Acromyrmex echinatior TaxID=103372 RepID=F4W8K6_ACREC|nr:hypothetical protein G5I_01787 [Acromyrmex echinatior]